MINLWSYCTCTLAKTETPWSRPAHTFTGTAQFRHSNNDLLHRLRDWAAEIRVILLKRESTASSCAWLTTSYVCQTKVAGILQCWIRTSINSCQERRRLPQTATMRLPTIAFDVLTLSAIAYAAHAPANAAGDVLVSTHAYRAARTDESHHAASHLNEWAVKFRRDSSLGTVSFSDQADALAKRYNLVNLGQVMRLWILIHSFIFLFFFCLQTYI